MSGDHVTDAQSESASHQHRISVSLQCDIIWTRSDAEYVYGDVRMITLLSTAIVLYLD